MTDTSSDNVCSSKRQLFTMHYTYSSCDQEYVFSFRGRPFAALVSPYFRTPTSSLLDYDLIKSLGLKLTDLQFSARNFTLPETNFIFWAESQQQFNVFKTDAAATNSIRKVLLSLTSTRHLTPIVLLGTKCKSRSPISASCLRNSLMMMMMTLITRKLLTTMVLARLSMRGSVKLSPRLNVKTKSVKRRM